MKNREYYFFHFPEKWKKIEWKVKKPNFEKYIFFTKLYVKRIFGFCDRKNHEFK